MIESGPLRRVRQSGCASPFSSFVSTLLLAALLFQCAPFAIHDAVPISGESREGATEYFEPLQVCGDSGEPGGFLADLPWMPPSLHVILFLPGGEFLFPSSPLSPPGVFLSKVYRPPRLLLS